MQINGEWLDAGCEVMRWLAYVKKKMREGNYSWDGMVIGAVCCMKSEMTNGVYDLSRGK